MKKFSFNITHKDKNSLARTGLLKTKHGKIETPYLVPVATRANVISLTKKDISELKIQALLANTYHLHFMPPGDKKIKNLGGLHKYMSFNKPLFTDSGGFQALSLGKGKIYNLRKIGFFPNKNKIINAEKNKTYAKITDKGILFRSVYDDKTESFIGPKESMQIQSNLGSDIIMAFDQCNLVGESKKDTKEAMLRSHKWEIESLKYKDKSQALYGIVHGGTFKDLRIKSTKFICSLPFDGIAIGGSLGKTKTEMYKIISWITPLLPENKPRHLLGIGWIDDIFHAVELGIDTFDCVEMTRIARHGQLYISPKSSGNPGNKFRIAINKATYKRDNKKIDSSCSCSTCKKYKRKDIHALYKDKTKTKEYNRLATIHNVHFMLSLMEKIRSSIKQGNFQKLKKAWLG